MNDLPAKKNESSVLHHQASVCTGCTICTQMPNAKRKGYCKNESLKLYHYLSHFTKRGTRGMMRAPFLSYRLSFGLPFGGKACRPRTLPSPAHTLRA